MALFIFIISVLCIIIRPFGLGIGTYALLGAGLSFALGCVSFADILSAASIVWDASLAFLGIVIFSLLLDEIGFFEHAARRTALLCRGSVRGLFFALMLLCAFVSALFANDAAVLILSPIILAQAKILQTSKQSTIALLLATGFLSDSASLPFVFSNLTNIITAGFFKISFWGYFGYMFVPFLASVGASIFFAFWILKPSGVVDLSLLKSDFKQSANKELFIFSWIFLAILLAGYALGDVWGLPFCVFALGGALLFFIITLRLKVLRFRAISSRIPWQILWFSLGFYIIVWGLKNEGYASLISDFLGLCASYGDLALTFGAGFMASLLSLSMNNLPAMMMMDISLENNLYAIFASIIGCNVGVKFTPFGSLATLLWLYTLRAKGQNISIKEYLIFSFKITLPVLIITLFALYLWLSFSV